MAHSRSSSITSSPNTTTTTNTATTTTTTTTTTGYKSMKPVSKLPSGVSKVWSKVEMLFSYVWLLIQVILLVAGLTVLNFATLMIVLTYSICGYFIRPRREFMSFKLESN